MYDISKESVCVCVCVSEREREREREREIQSLQLGACFQSGNVFLKLLS